MTRMANLRALLTVDSTPPDLPLQRGGKRQPFFLVFPLVICLLFFHRMRERLRLVRSEGRGDLHTVSCLPNEDEHGQSQQGGQHEETRVAQAVHDGA